MNYPNILFIEAGSHPDEGFSRLMDEVASSGVHPVRIQFSELAAYLKKAAGSAQPPLAVVVSADVAQPIAVAREVKLASPFSDIILVRHSEQLAQLRHELSHAPMIGSHWSIAAADDQSLAARITEATRLAQRRIKLRTTLDRANVQITRHKAVDSVDYRRLLISEHYLTSFLAQAKDAIVGLDNELHVLHWNSSAEQLFGLPAEDALNLPIRKLPFWSSAVGEAIQKVQNDGNALMEEVVCSLTAKQIVVEIAFSAVYDHNGNTIGMLLVMRDVSLRYEKLEQEREQREATTRMIDNERRRLIGLFDQAPGFMAVTRGPQHQFEMANQAYYQIVGQRELIGLPIQLALPELKDQPFVQLLDEVYTTGRAYVGRSMSIFLQRKPSAAMDRLFIDFVLQPSIEPDGSVSGIFCQGNDVTEQKLMHDALLQYQTQLEQLVIERTAELQKAQLALHQSQKLEAIGKLTGGVAHDFNNILQVIRSNLELLSATHAGETQALSRIKSAITAVDRGAKLSSQLLAFARRQPLQPVPTNLGRVLRDIDELLRRVLGETIEIETVVGGGLWTTMVDPNQLENVILNLVINARDAMDGAGKLTLELGNAMLDDFYVQAHPEVAAGQYVMLAVTDTGCGMPPEIIERVFEPFFTTKREGEGTGLGLSMVYGFVKQTGGHIKIYSEPGNGTIVKIYLPRSHQEEVLLCDVRPGPIRGGTETILVVEDDAAVQAAAVDMLSGLGYTVLKASDGQSALSILQSGISVDLLFTDVVMPGPVRSPDLARQAKVLLPEIAVLFTSGYTQNAIVHGGRLDPGVDLISKPYRQEDLARKIRHIFANKQQATQLNASLDIAKSSAVSQHAANGRRILVVEDNEDSQAMLCELLTLLGYQAHGVSTAEQASDLLKEFDVLLTDVNLPGMSGIELARKAYELHPAMTIIFASGADVQPNLEFRFHVLPKPYTLVKLKEVLLGAHKTAL